MKHKYQLVIEFETLKPVRKHADALIQFENALAHLVSCSNGNGCINYISETYQYGTGKTTLKKLGKGQNEPK